VLRHSEAKLGARLVLLVLADHASDDGTGAWPSVGTIAQEARMSESQTRECLRRLERNGAIKANGTSPYRTVIYDVIMAPTEIRGGADTGPKPSLERETSQGVTHTGGVQGGMRAPAAVDRKPVNGAEAHLAMQVLAAWNRATGQSLRATATLGKIIMRLREYPELDLAAHEHIIDVSLARPWWRGTPSPNVIYGNDAQFERQLAEASRSATSEVQSAFDVAMRVLNERSSR
jgi:hypothetical protein